MNCPVHGKVKTKKYYHDKRWITLGCPKCAEERKQREFERSEALQQEGVNRRRAARIEKALSNSGIPKRFARHSLDTYRPQCDASRRVHAVCRDYANQFPSHLSAGTSLILCGNTGTGKTHLACGIANQVIHQYGSSAVFVKVMDAIRQVKQTWSRDAVMSETQALNLFTDPDLLILDEVGMQFGSDAEKLVTFEIINKRYESMRPTILLSNFNPKAMQEYAGERIMDRMSEGDGMVLQFSWGSYRGKN